MEQKLKRIEVGISKEQLPSYELQGRQEIFSLIDHWERILCTVFATFCKSKVILKQEVNKK